MGDEDMGLFVRDAPHVLPSPTHSIQIRPKVYHSVLRAEVIRAVRTVSQLSYRLSRVPKTMHLHKLLVLINVKDGRLRSLALQNAAGAPRTCGRRLRRREAASSSNLADLRVSAAGRQPAGSGAPRDRSGPGAPGGSRTLRESSGRHSPRSHRGDYSSQKAAREAPPRGPQLPEGRASREDFRTLTSEPRRAGKTAAERP